MPKLEKLTPKTILNRLMKKRHKPWRIRLGFNRCEKEKWVDDRLVVFMERGHVLLS